MTLFSRPLFSTSGIISSFLVALSLLFTAWQLPLAASTSYELSIEDSDIYFTIWQPEGFLETKNKNLDLEFYEEQDPNTKLAFHYFIDPQFSLSSFSEVYDYMQWLTESFFLDNSEKTRVSYRSSNKLAVQSFILQEKSKDPLYCYIAVSTTKAGAVFSCISTSTVSSEVTKNNLLNFLDGVNWRVPKEQ